MSFWDLNDKQQTLATDGSFDSNPDLEVIPKGTCVTAMATEAGWEQNQGEYAKQEDGSRYIKLRWDVVDGEFKGRVIFQKLWLERTDASKRDKALQMLAAIDANAGGKLMAAGQEPTDLALMQCLANKPQILQLDVWENNGTEGNWVRAVYNKAKGAPAPKAAATSPEPTGQAGQGDIGF